MVSNPRSHPLTAERVRALVGELSDDKVLEILKLRPSEKDLLEAQILRSEGEVPASGLSTRSAVAARIFDILGPEHDEDDEIAR